MDSLLVLTGVAAAKRAQSRDTVRKRPTYVAPDLSGSWRCSVNLW